MQKKLKKKLSHLMLVSDVSTQATADPHTGHGSDEERPLLSNEEPPGCSTSSEQQDNSKVTCNHSLIPDSSLSAQVQRRPRWMNFKHCQGKAQSCKHSTPCWLLTYLYHSGCGNRTVPQSPNLHQITCYTNKKKTATLFS